MRLKSKDIAEYLGISPATVSLALNNKPSVKEETKRKIFDYIHEFEKSNPIDLETENTILGKIKVVLYLGREKIINDTTINLLPSALEIIEKEARLAGYEVGVVYFSKDEDVVNLLESVKSDFTKGIILFATEMHDHEFDAFKELDIPVVIHDYDFEETDYDAFVINNCLAVKVGMKYLKVCGLQDVMYFYNASHIYNFSERRRGYKESAKEFFDIEPESNMVEMGTEIDEIYRNVTDYIVRGGRLPEAIFCENYSVSVGTVTALKDLHIKVPEDISIIGIDEIPRYLMQNLRLTCIKVSHEKRAELEVRTLIHRIEQSGHSTGVLYSFAPQLIMGDSVKIIRNNDEN